VEADLVLEAPAAEGLVLETPEAAAGAGDKQD
jgi:hypothetical protein